MVTIHIHRTKKINVYFDKELCCKTLDITDGDNKSHRINLFSDEKKNLNINDC